MSIAAYTLWNSNGSMAMSGLSHLIVFDSLGAMLCVAVDILGNFEVWKRSSIRHPFGLERAEVLAAFALSVLLFFMGGDLISHTLQTLLAKEHNQRPAAPTEEVFVSVALLAIASTLISAFALKNHARIGRAVRFTYMQSLPSILSNPAHFLTLSCSSILLLPPLLSFGIHAWFDRILSFSVGIAMCTLGIHLVKDLGSILLISFTRPGVSDVIHNIKENSSVIEVEEAKFWQVHYNLCMANIRLKVRGSEESLVKLRERITSTIRNRLAGGYGESSGGQKWEISLQLTIAD